MARRKMIDISMFGDTQIQHAFNALRMTEAKKIARLAARESAKAMKSHIAAAAPVDTGNLRAALQNAKIRSSSNRRSVIRIGVFMPTRNELGIPHDTAERKFAYYPMVLEYGSAARGIAPRRWIRNETDRRTPAEHDRMRQIVSRGIVEAFRKRTRRVRVR